MIIQPNEVILAIGMLWQSGANLPPIEVICMTRNIYHEARGEPLKGQIAVAYVTLERTEQEERPDTVCGVVGERLRGVAQFSWVDGAENEPPSEWASYEASMQVAIDVMMGRVRDPVPGATYFYAFHTSKPGWARQFKLVAQIGNHRFMKEND